MAEDTAAKKLSELLSLQHELREITNSKDFGFFVVNETHRLVPYKTAVLWQADTAKKAQVLALSGITHVDPHAGLTQFLQRIISLQHSNIKEAKILTFNRRHFSEKIQADWPDKLADEILWCPLTNPAKAITGGLWLCREESWTDKELRIINWLAQSYSYSWAVLTQQTGLQKKFSKFGKNKKRTTIGSALAAIMVCFFPVSQTVLAPAEIIAKNPVMITAPMQGVIEKVDVKPNQAVEPGMRLFSMDKTEVGNANQLAKKELDVTRAKYNKAIQAGFSDRNSRADINILKAQLQEQQLEVNYSSALLQKADITATSGGVAIFGHSEDWMGQPVTTGEKVMMIAKPNEVQVEIWLPVSDAINFAKDAAIKVFLNRSPLHAYSAHILQTSFDAEVTASQTLAYRVVAELENTDDLPQLGGQGTAKIYGDKVPLIYYLLRRPLSALRQTVGV